MKWSKRGASYYKYHHYHYPYIIGIMVSPLINVVNLKETWTKTTTKCVNKPQYTSAIG
jgi:endoglucanase Acf2